VLASDSPAHREVAGPDCRFFDPDDPGQLASLVLEDAATGAAERPRARPGRAALATWDDAARELIEICTRMSRLGPKAP
jgi:hypothetical protein